LNDVLEREGPNRRKQHREDKVHKRHVSKVSSGFAYFLLTFAYESVLALYLVVLGVEFNSASNGALGSTCCSAEKRSFTPNTGQNARFSRYILLIFVHGPVLALYLVVLGVEFNSASNGANLNTCCSAGNRSFTLNTGSKAGFSRYILLTFAHRLVLAL
jgi:hypothetical protein